MRLIEETLVQADAKLNEEINSNIDLFIQQIKKSSTQKGIRWDEIVIKFEYETVHLPKLKQQVSSASFNNTHRDFLNRYLEQNPSTIDSQGLKAVIDELEIIEHPITDYNQYIIKVLD
jgi:hypothetical protein